MKRYILALDLVNDPKLIAEYDSIHQRVSKEIKESITSAGIEVMDIYRFGNRLFMLMEVNETFSFERKEKMDEENQKVQEWERLMWGFQQAIPGAKEGEKWVVMDKIFEL